MIEGRRAATEGLPTGTVTFVFTDVEGSTRLLADLGAAAYADLLGEHRRVVRQAFRAHHGHEVDTQGDAFFYAFGDATDALRAAADAQTRLADGPMRIRIGIHTGRPTLTVDGYVGLDIHRAARIAAVGHGGQVLISEAARLVVSESIGALELVDLGEHRLKDLTEREHIHQVGAGTFPPLNSLNRSNLPVASTPLVGREEELAALLELLRDGAREVTVLGPGGTGKTRLALQAAAELVDDFPGGVFWVALAGLREPELVLPTIGQALEAEGDLVEAIGKKRLLLLLDNFEQLIEAAPAIGDLLSQAAGLKVLVTSRTPLHIAAERQFALDPMSDADAITFFVDRAAAAGVALEPGPEVARLCRRLDRLPLALELAASRLKILGLHGLLSRLDHALPVLTSGARDAPARQRTLRAAIEWSYDLLGTEAKSLFPRLGVFAGSFALDAAETVCAADAQALEELVDASLVKAAGDGRFAILETIREFAIERLEASFEAAAIRRGHGAYFLDLAERSETQLAGRDQGPWMLRLVDDQDNLREAMAVGVEAGEAELATRFGAALWLFWYRRGDMIEADRWYALIRPLAERVGDGLRARFLYGAAQVPMMRADWPRTRDELQETQRLAAQSGETKTLVRALSDLGSTYHFLGDAAASAAAFDQGLTAARSSGDRPRAAMIVGNAGQVALEDGELVRAERLLGEALREYGELGDLLGLSSVLHSQGSLCLRRGEVVAAARSFSDGLAAIRSSGMLSTISSFIVASATVALERDDVPSAARLLGAADAVAERLGFAFWEFEGAAETAAKARSALGDDAFDSAHSEGAKLDFEEALDESERVLADALGS